MKGKRAVIIARLMLIFIVFIGVALIYIWVRISKITRHEEDKKAPVEYHFVLITEDGEDDFWNQVYKGAISNTGDHTVYLERMGANLAMDYDKEVLLTLAIESKVDGIFLEGNGSEEEKALIAKADEAGIPVVTLLGDNYGSARKAFVGVSDYDLGREYARQVIKVATTDMSSILIFMDEGAEDLGQNIFYNGLSETLQNEGNHLNLMIDVQALSREDSFEAQEVLREKLVNSDMNPDIVIGLNESSTVSAYQAIIDYNLAGEVKIIGYHDSPEILNAIEKKVVDASVVIDATQVGERGMQALLEYEDTGYVNEYITMNVKTINSTNVGEYRTDETNN